MSVIGIGGTSRSGKSSLAISLSEVLENATVIHQDEFNAEILPRIRDHVDWEIPAAVDFKKIISSIEEKQLSYDHIVVEGILIFAHPGLNSLFDKRIVLTIDEESFKKRKRLDLRWGQEPEWYIQHIWDSHLEYGFPPQKFDQLVLNTSTSIDIDQAINYIRR
ncbi:hypothetical protein [Fulvivirga sedimenti]|uniref:Phosphoribulokinase/uridine kinase domain-containing protein n=1 Tax=Fulvivirga sedimenti TaxID=2879465 RepID=A0A9X1L2S8_9BACT|nr:hypothetical protein [Fulvivirga sedimenti]MCA6078511.1 hypothetical protein [Fulvivirga sedimenti]